MIKRKTRDYHDSLHFTLSCPSKEKSISLLIPNCCNPAD
jgi:hypothetical protein